jgi:hypothetical protein
MSRRAANHGSIERHGDRVIYRDARGVAWRLHDFIDGPHPQLVEVGSPAATKRIFVREGGTERRRALFHPREDTLTPTFNYHRLATAAIRSNRQWTYETSILRNPT